MGKNDHDDDSTLKSAAKTAAKGAVATKVAKEVLSSDDDSNDESGGKGKLLLFLLTIGGALGWFMKKRRDKELDEALWEEPRAL